jgi:hypothetical protein
MKSDEVITKSVQTSSSNITITTQLSMMKFVVGAARGGTYLKHLET